MEYKKSQEKSIVMDKLTLGVCYYPEHWPEYLWNTRGQTPSSLLKKEKYKRLQKIDKY